MEKIKKMKSVPNQIRNHLESKGTKQVWLAEKTGISQEHISNILADRVLLTDEVLNKINEVLGTDFKK
jgi:plasmid maintenance system antidote protein VapI